MDAANGEEAGCKQLASDQEDEGFWMNLQPRASLNRSHISDIPTQAPRCYPGNVVRSRADALRAAMTHGKDIVVPNG